MIITTPRLTLRRFAPNDVDAMHAIFSDPAAMAYWSTLPHTSLAQTEDWIARTMASVDAGKSDDFVVLHNGIVIGKAGLWEGDELGMIFATSSWGTGLAREAVEAVIAHARGRGVRAIMADVDPRNVRALRFLERLGFTVTGTAKATYQLGDYWADSVYLTLQLRPNDPGSTADAV